KFLSINQLHFQSAEERFHRSIIPAVSFPTHTRIGAVTPDKIDVLLRTILHTSIRVDDQTWPVASSIKGHLCGTDHQLLCHAPIQRPTNNSSGVQVHHRS